MSDEQRPNRRQFLAVSAAASACLLLNETMKAQNRRSDNFELNEATIADLQAKMQSGETNSKQITEKYLERIANLDRRLVNSVIQTNIDALKIAQERDRERKAGRIRSALHGIPVLVKDNIDTADEMPNTAGSLALLDNFPKQDAFLIQRLREAGAVILGKTNLSEWANFRSSKSSSGWSARGGQTRNPYILDRNPCGSSSGSGAAVSANFAAAAIGTETDGSIICPSTTCGIVGIKPTLGLISRSGIIPISHSQDTAGPMARCVADAAALLSVLTGVDARDSATKSQKAEKDYARFLQKDGLRGARLGVARQFFGRNQKIDAAMKPVLDALKNGGATLIDVEFPTYGKFGDAEFTVLLYEFKADLNKYLATATTKYKTLAQLIEFNEGNKDKEMPFFGQEIFLDAQKKGDLNEREYRLALRKSKMLAGEQGIDAVVLKNKLDAIVSPSGGVAWMTDLINGDCGVFEAGTSLAAVAGYPHITVPAGFVDNLPVGVSFFGRAWTETALIKIAYAYEQATKFRKPPQFFERVSY
jgi:amidase